MFTPQRNRRSGVWFSAAGDNDNGSVLGKSKGKGVEGDEGPMVSPPQALLGDKGSDSVVRRGEVDDWRSFKEAGLLDQSVLQRRDRGALVQRISDIEKELHEYQYNMGLLLIEKKDWFSKYEEMREGRAEAEVMLKREQTAHLIAVSELQKREENMQKALGVEKQCVADLEKALREMRAEIAEVKFTSEKKLADANSMEAIIEEKHLEVEGKLHSADAKLAEASRKSSEINRKMVDLEDRERKLQRDFLSLNNERKAHEKDLSEQRQHLQNWEKKLQEGQKRLVDGQRFLNEREERANESESILKKKEEEIEEARRAIEVKKNSLKDKDDDVNTRLGSLTIKEEEIESKKQNLVKKENVLLALEEKLNAREKVELQKLLDDHNAILDAKKQDFELEIDQKRKSFAEELNTKLEAVEKEKTGVVRKEKEVVKREQALENKMEKLKIKEKDLDTKSKALKKWEECIKDDEKKLQAEKQQLGHDTHELVVSKSVLESLKSAIESEKLQISSEKESLKVTQEEREQLLLLQSKLKQEIEEYQMLKESFLRESETLRQERVKFEKEWEALDEKRVAFEAEVQHITDERSNFEKWRHNEEERLSKEVHQARVDVNRELENLQLKREAFESTMELERSEAREMLKRDRADIARELELRRHELEMDMQKKREEMEKKMQEKESDFDRRRESELSHIKTSSSLNESAVRKIHMEQDRLVREKEQLSIDRTKLEADRVEIQKDIDTLGVLSKNVKGQREEFIKERAHLLALADECKTCKNCGVTIHEFELLGFKSTRENELVENTVLPSLSDGRFADMASPLSPGSGGARMSWLQKCSNLFRPSPNKKAENSAEGPPLDMLDSIAETSDIASLKSGGLKVSEEREILAVEGGWRTRSDINSGGRAAEQILPTVSEQNEMEVSSPPPEIDPQPSKQRRQQPGRKVGRPKTIRRTKSVAEVVEDAKAFLGEASGLEKSGHLKPHHEESLGESGRSSQVAARGGLKRRLPNTDEDAEDSEVRSESVSQGGRRKRRQTSVPAVQPPAEKRYNLRHSKRASTAATAQGTADQTKVIEEVSHQEPLESEEIKDVGNGEGTSQHGHSAAPSAHLGGEIKETTDIMEETIGGNLLGIQDISSQKLARFEARTTRVELSRDILSAEDVDEVDGSEAAPEETGTPSDCEDSDDDEDSEKGNASLGKKLWTFFTT